MAIFLVVRWNFFKNLDQRTFEDFYPDLTESCMYIVLRRDFDGSILNRKYSGCEDEITNNVVRLKDIFYIWVSTTFF